MLLHDLFQQKKENSAVYKAVTENDITLSELEKQKVLKEALFKKIAAINSENYSRVVNYEPEYKIPVYSELYSALISYLEKNENWVIDEFNDLPLKKIASYFSADSDFEMLEDGYDLEKGLLLVGPIGCGKTSILKILQKNSFNPFRFISCRKIADEYAEFGHSAIANYSNRVNVSRREWFNHDNIALCFDDLGTESEKKNFGNQVNVMAEIILNRYDNLESKNKTMVTTNLIADQLERTYGARATSRMREMFNVIEFPFDGPDRRK